MSIRIRLTAWYLLVLILGFVAFGIAVSWQTQQTANSAFDQTLRERANELRPYVRLRPTVRLLPHAPNEGAGLLGETSAWIRILDEHGRVVATQGPALTHVPASLLATRRAGFQDSGNLHMFVQPLRSRGSPRALIQTITTGQEINASGQRLISAMAIVGAFILLLAAFAGLFLSDRALRPVDRITRVAEEIGEGDLRRRVTPEISGPDGEVRSPRDEISHLASTFDGMLSRLEEADTKRRQLTADAAHELSTPVATITAGAEIALRRERTPEEYRDALQLVVEEGRHLGRMVGDLLLLARADAGQLQVKHELVELDETCRSVAASMRPLARKRDIDLQVDLPSEPVLVEGDEMRLGQVIRNLLDNAFRYTPAGGDVRLSINSPEQGGHKAEVTMHVQDSGPGIPLAERERVFERFHRVIDTMRAGDTDMGSMPGSGLGLAICKAIVEAHGGQIEVTEGVKETSSTHLGGAHIIIILPAAK